MCDAPDGIYEITYSERSGDCGPMATATQRFDPGGEPEPPPPDCMLVTEHPDSCTTELDVTCSGPLPDEPDVIDTARLLALFRWNASATRGEGVYDVSFTYSDGVDDCHSVYDVVASGL